MSCAIRCRQKGVTTDYVARPNRAAEIAVLNLLLYGKAVRQDEQG